MNDSITTFVIAIASLSGLVISLAWCCCCHLVALLSGRLPTSSRHLVHIDGVQQTAWGHQRDACRVDDELADTAAQSLHVVRNGRLSPAPYSMLSKQSRKG